MSGVARRSRPEPALRRRRERMNPPSEWHYVAAAYLVVFVAVLVWVAMIGAKLQRLQRQLATLVDQAREREAAHG